MTIQTEKNGASIVTLSLSGRLDTASAPQLDRKLKQFGGELSEIILDFSGLTYISSMGLRVLLQTQKALVSQGRKMTIKNMNESIREVFEMTGFVKLMMQEEKFVVIKKAESGNITLSLMGQMEPSNVSVIARELAALKEVHQGRPFSIVMDAAKLSVSSEGTCKLLKTAIGNTDWQDRKISVQNAAPEIRTMFETLGMGKLLNS